jgi:hypothetical protein
MKPATTPEVNAVCLRIGTFYRNKFGNNDKALQEVESLGISNIDIVNGYLEITLLRPGKLIGVRGKNIDELGTFLGMNVKIIEAKVDWAWLICRDFPENHETLDFTNLMNH